MNSISSWWQFDKKKKKHGHVKIFDEFGINFAKKTK